MRSCETPSASRAGLGGWYFEFAFPISMIDASGKVLGRGQARATSDWTATGSAPFKATIEFGEPDTATGFIVLRNDNPSGLPENAKEAKMFIGF